MQTGEMRSRKRDRKNALKLQQQHDRLRQVVAGLSEKLQYIVNHADLIVQKADGLYSQEGVKMSWACFQALMKRGIYAPVSGRLFQRQV